jgi:hypothetical protein
MTGITCGRAGREGCREGGGGRVGGCMIVLMGKRIEEGAGTGDGTPLALETRNPEGVGAAE